MGNPFDQPLSLDLTADQLFDHPKNVVYSECIEVNRTSDTDIVVNRSGSVLIDFSSLTLQTVNENEGSNSSTLVSSCGQKLSEKLSKQIQYDDEEDEDGEENNDKSSVKAYVDFDMFYNELENSLKNKVIDQEQFEQYSQISN